MNDASYDEHFFVVKYLRKKQYQVLIKVRSKSNICQQALIDGELL